MDDADIVGISVILVETMDDAFTVEVEAIGVVVDGATIVVADAGADEKGELVSVNNRAMITFLHI